jgi:hypothetical protein
MRGANEKSKRSNNQTRQSANRPLPSFVIRRPVFIVKDHKPNLHLQCSTLTQWVVAIDSASKRINVLDMGHCRDNHFFISFYSIYLLIHFDDNNRINNEK